MSCVPLKWEKKKKTAKTKVDSPHPQVSVLPAQSGSSQERSRIILCEYIYMKRILNFFLSMDRKASISAYIHDFARLIKERKPFQEETL